MNSNEIESFLSGWTITTNLPSHEESIKGLKRFRESLAETPDDTLDPNAAALKNDLLGSLEFMEQHPAQHISIQGAEKDLEKLAELFLKFAQDRTHRSVTLTTQNVLDSESNIDIIITKAEETTALITSASIDKLRRQRQLDLEAIGWVWEDRCRIRTKLKKRSDMRPILEISANKAGLISLANLCLYVLRNKGNPEKDHVSIDQYSGLEEESECDVSIENIG